MSRWISIWLSLATGCVSLPAQGLGELDVEHTGRHGYPDC
jgi:hypothetical protein